MSLNIFNSSSIYLQHSFKLAWIKPRRNLPMVSKFNYSISTTNFFNNNFIMILNIEPIVTYKFSENISNFSASSSLLQSIEMKWNLIKISSFWFLAWRLPCTRYYSFNSSHLYLAAPAQVSGDCSILSG